MGIRLGKPSLNRAAGGNSELQRGLTIYDNRLTSLERATSHLAANPSKQGPSVGVPPSSRLSVSAARGTGQFQVSITLPHLINPPAGKSRNQSIAPIFHEVSYAPTPAFRTGLVVLPPSTQTFFPISVAPGSSWYARIRGSFDGKKWGPYVRYGLVTA